MQIHVKGVEKAYREDTKSVILYAMEAHGISYPLWSWDWGDQVEVTDGEGNRRLSSIIIELPGTEAIRAAVDNGLLEQISGDLIDAVVYVVMAPVEASFHGKRLI